MDFFGRGNWWGRALASALGLILDPTSGTSAQLEHCGFEYPRLVCAYPGGAYQIQLPGSPRDEDRIPVVVVFHDAGGEGADILEEHGLIDWFAAEGFAVIVPEALPRRNRRIKYFDDRPGLVEGQNQLHPFTFSKKKFVVERADGSIDTLTWNVDTGWYFYSTDLVRYTMGEIGNPETDYIGRDEIKNLIQILSHAEREHGTAPQPDLIAGIGHGASLVWQIVCYQPKLANIFAPVGAAFWHRIPTDCGPGARLVHSHHRGSEFWPLEGVAGSDKRFARTSILHNLEMLLAINGCEQRKKIEGRDNQGFGYTKWEDCKQGGPIELVMTDDAVDFPHWWVNEMLNRIDSAAGRPPVQAEVPLETSPVFRRRDDGSEQADEGGPAFKRPGDAQEAPQRTGPAFMTPGSDSGQRFKRPG